MSAQGRRWPRIAFIHSLGNFLRHRLYLPLFEFHEGDPHSKTLDMYPPEPKFEQWVAKRAGIKHKRIKNETLNKK